MAANASRNAQQAVYTLYYEIAQIDAGIDQPGGNLGGVGDIAAPAYASKAVRNLSRTYEKNDFIGFISSIVRLNQFVLGFVGAVSSLSEYIQKVQAYIPNKVLNYLVPGGIIVGLVHCAIEGVVEMVELFKQIRFYRSPLMSLSRIVDNMGSEPTAAELRALAAEFRAMENQLKAPISGKKGNGLRDDDKRLVVDAKEGPGAFEDAEKCSFLAARCATMARDLDQGKAWTQLNNIHFSEVKAAVVHTFDNRYFNRDYFFPSKNENGIPIARSDGIKRARELVGGIGTQAALRFGAEVFYLRDNVPTDMANNGHFFAYINQQARKKLALHVIGLIATICTIAALTLALVSGGWIAITALSAAAFILSNTRTIVHSMIGNAGYGWTFASLLPQFLAKRIRPNPQEEAIAQAEQIA